MKRRHKEDLKLQSVVERIKEYWQNWKSHVDRMVGTRIPKQGFEYTPMGTRDRERSRKKLS